MRTYTDLGGVNFLVTTNLFNYFYNEILQEFAIESSAGSYGVCKINLKGQFSQGNSGAKCFDLISIKRDYSEAYIPKIKFW